MQHDLTEHIRDAGYEALFLFGGFLALSAHPTQRNLDRVLQWIDESQSRRQQFKRLVQRGLIESASGDQFAARLTQLGHAAFAGGRHPEAAWNRNWDGQWRLFTFDLPRKENELRMRLRRWLKANYFGRAQGSVWISPDPVPAVEAILATDPIDSLDFIVFEGHFAGKPDPREVSQSSWSFDAINAAYRTYEEFALRTLETVRRKTPSASSLKRILDEDRGHWWAAIRRDPLLPKALHPKEYGGINAWKVRGKLLRRLGKAVGEA